MYCSIHTNIHPMIGVDFHVGTPGPPVPPAPNIPHFVAQVLGGLNITAKLVPTVLSHNFIVINQSSDIGMGIGHVAPNILFPLYVLTSSSISNFGSFTVLSGGKPTAAAIGVYVNMNLNCGQPVNTPTGMVVAPGCNMVGLSFAEFMAGMASIAVNMAISYVAGKIGGKIGEKVSGWAMSGICNIAGRVSVSAGLMSAAVLSTKFVSKVVEEVIGAPIGQLIGGPAGAVGDFITEEMNEAILPNYSRGELVN